MNKLLLLLLVIALMACVACQRQQAKERKNVKPNVRGRSAWLRNIQPKRNRGTEGEGNPNARENASEMLPSRFFSLSRHFSGKALHASNRKHKSSNRAGSCPCPRRSTRRLRQRQHRQNPDPRSRTRTKRKNRKATARKQRSLLQANVPQEILQTSSMAARICRGPALCFVPLFRIPPTAEDAEAGNRVRPADGNGNYCRG